MCVCVCGGEGGGHVFHYLNKWDIMLQLAWKVFTVMNGKVTWLLLIRVVCKLSCP